MINIVNAIKIQLKKEQLIAANGSKEFDARTLTLDEMKALLA